LASIGILIAIWAVITTVVNWDDEFINKISPPGGRYLQLIMGCMMFIVGILALLEAMGILKY